LEERLQEYMALGGLKELLDRRALILVEQKLPAPFYWDLWGNLEHLRGASLSGCRSISLDVPNDEEEQEVDSDSDISWETDKCNHFRTLLVFVFRSSLYSQVNHGGTQIRDKHRWSRTKNN
jgi:hypothetical protein